MGKTYRRFSTEFKLQLVEAYLAGAGSIKGIATGAGIDHSLLHYLHYWIRKYRAGELSLDVVREETLIESEQKVAALERKVGQLTMELDLLKGGLIAVPAMNNARSLIISGPAASAPGEDAS
jgi:transposase-like protein